VRNPVSRRETKRAYRSSVADSIRVLKSNNADRNIPEKNRAKIFVAAIESGWAAAFGLTHPLAFACEG
jgi:hypothetical protein